MDDLASAQVKSNGEPLAAPLASSSINQNNTTVQQRIPASINKRFLNHILDWYILLTSLTVVGFLSGYFQLTFINNYAEKPNSFTNYIIGAVSLVIFYTFFEAIWQKSPAKFLTKTKVVTKTGATPSFTTILLRSVCRLIPFEIFSFLSSKNPIGLHDSLSKTMVIDEKKNEKSTRSVIALIFLFIAEYFIIALLFGLLIMLMMLPIYLTIQPFLENTNTTINSSNTTVQTTITPKIK